MSQELQQFEEKILDITGDNLEIITGHTFQLSLEEIASPSEDSAAELKACTVQATVSFSSPDYEDWQLFFPEDMAAFLVATMVGEEPGDTFDPGTDTESFQELLAQILSPYLSELSSMEGKQIDTESLVINVSDEVALPGETLLLTYKAVVEPEKEFRFYKMVTGSFAEILTAKAEEEDQEHQEHEMSPAEKQETVEMAGAQFQAFNSGGTQGNGSNLEMLMDLEMPITIELGRTRMAIKRILELGQGSVVELEKLSGDPVDVFINDRKFAEGEVVVVDENFGVRITEIVSPVEKIQSLQ